MKRVEELVFAFRKAIEAAKENDETEIFFRKFPVGQCGDASDMLAQFLIDNGIGPIRYVNGTYYGDDGSVMQSHAWLVVKDSIIDITGDQFQYCAQPLTNDIPVYIGPMNTYYNLFDTTFGSDHEHFGIEGSWFNSRDLWKWYNTILNYIVY